MSAAIDEFLSFVLLQRRRHLKRLNMASFVAALIAVLLYETKWPNLRSGLVVLLAGQMGDVLALLARRVQLSNDLDRKRAEAMNEAAISAWFEREELFVRRLAFFDTACQVVGFLTVGYAFWVTTGSLWLSLAIGLVYPLAAYLGMTRRKNLQAIGELRAKKQELR